MKRKNVKVIAALTAATLLMTSCAQSSDKKSRRERRRDRENREDRDDAERQTERNNRPSQYVPTPNYLGEGQQTWFEEQGLTFTEIGTFDMNVYSNFYGYTTVPGRISLETNYDCEEGYKNIIATTVIDISGVDTSFWTSSFDKYTGTSFEFHNESTSLYNGCNVYREGDVELQIGDYNYTLHISDHTIMEDDITTVIYVITCPIEYDGTVLQYGAYYADGEHFYDFSSGNVWYADDFTDMHWYFDYFTLQGLPIDAK